METNRKISWLMILLGFGLFAIQAGEIMISHGFQSWDELVRPEGFGHILRALGGVVLGVLGYMGIRGIQEGNK